MTRHLVRLIWNRKRQNFLLTVEIFFSFLVLVGVMLMAVSFADNWRRPLGFSIDRVWRIGVDRKEHDQDPAVKARHREMFRMLLAELRALSPVEVAAAGYNSPYDSSNWGQSYDLEDGRSIRYGLNNVTAGFLDAVGLTLIDGRWFTREDTGVNWMPIVVNRRMARELFGDASAVGRRVPLKHTPGRTVPRERRIIGVVEDFRKDGELSQPANFAFFQTDLDRADAPGDLPWVLVVRVAPGTPAAFEETIVKRLQSVARDWSFEVRPLTEMREETLRRYTTPLYALGTIAVFLLLMVALGLTGVVWQSVTQRTREFGLRRAKGATIPNVRNQVLAELMIMTSIALVVGVALVLQLPLLPLEGNVLPNPGVVATSIAVSVATIYVLTLLCGWYPSRLATRIQPAEALHYE
jgi:putative ABC transport system permease protein